MPCLNLTTNVDLSGVDTSALLAEATETVADLIGKPKSYVMVTIKGSVPISFGGTQEPAAHGELVSVGGLSPILNRELSSRISEILESRIRVSKSRIYLRFTDSKANQAQELAQCLHALHQE